MLIALVALALGGATTSAQTLTDETLLSNDPDTDSSSGGNCEGRALKFRTGSSDATLSSVRVRADSSNIDVEVRDDSSGDPSTSVRYQLTNGTLSGSIVTLSAPASATLSANTDYWLVIPPGSAGTCKTQNRTFSTLHGWSAESFKWWNNNQWNDDSGYYLVDIIGAVHGGAPHEPERDREDEGDDYQSIDYEPLPECTEEQRQMRQRGRELPPACRGGFYHEWVMYPSSDPCDQVWQVPGSYRPERGCLNRPEGSYSYSGPTGPREVPSPPPEPVYEYFPVEDANGNCCISERRRVR